MDKKVIWQKAAKRAFDELNITAQKWQFLYPNKTITARWSSKNKKHIKYINMRVMEIIYKMPMSSETKLMHNAIAKEIKVDGVSVGNPYKSYEYQDYIQKRRELFPGLPLYHFLPIDNA